MYDCTTQGKQKPKSAMFQISSSLPSFILEKNLMHGSDVHEDLCLTYNCEVMAPGSVGQLQDAANMAI